MRIDSGQVGAAENLPMDKLGLYDEKEKEMLPIDMNTDDRAVGDAGSSPIDLNSKSPEPEESIPYRCKWAPRPNFGRAGRPIALVSNYFNLSCKTGNIYHYHIEINSLDWIKKYGRGKTKQTAAEAASANVSRIKHQMDRNIGKLKCKDVFEQLVKNNTLKQYNPVYDGVKNIFTSKPFPFQSKQTFTVDLEVFGKIRKYEVTLQPVKKENGSNVIDMKSLGENYDGQNELIMAYNSVLNHRDPPVTQINLGRSFFFLNSGRKMGLGDGLEIWFGYNQSIHWTQKGPSLVINLAAKAFHKEGPVINYVSDLLKRDLTRDQGLNYYEIRKVEEALKGVKVTVTHLAYKRKYTVHGVSKESARNLKLNYDGKELSVMQYFQSKYAPLKYPQMHCLHMRASNKQTFIPFENCLIVEGQPLLGKMSAQLNAKMIRETAIAPEERFKTIDQSAKHVLSESGSKMTAFSIKMDMAPRKLMGRVIDPPTLAYLNKGTCNPDNRGVWRMEGRAFYRASINIESWVILCFADCNKSNIERFAETFVTTGKKYGLNIGRLLGIKKFGKHDACEVVLKEAEKTRASFAIIILSRNDTSHNYDEIKFIADYKLGFVTQCMDEKVLMRFNDQIATNLCLKVNTKLGGVNHILVKKPKVFNRPVMILGADAVHSPRGTGCPSIASVVGSMDAFPSRYKVACRVQDNPDGKLSQEVILDIKDMVTSLLNAFYHNTHGKYPEKIIFFRDGVSEGQFEAVRDKEVVEVQKASQDVIGRVVPITFIIVQKRHQTRLRPQNARDGIGKSGNIPPGTTVDNDLTHPDHFDYFLNSHEGIQGTSKPAHYTVLHDDNNFDADELQELSYHLCYTYGKCNRSISIPAPVMYADLACYRAKKYADFHLQKERECGSFSSNSSTKLSDHARLAINTMGDFRTSMFFV